MKKGNHQILNNDDIKLLRGLIRKRWIATFKRLAITLLLPVVCVLAVSIFLNIIYLRARIPDKYGAGVYINLIILQSIDDLKMFGFLLLPGLYLVMAANLWLFIITIPPAYIDLLRRRKNLIQFAPEQYRVSETNQYYLKTNIAAFPFFEVDFNTYCKIENTKSLIIEALPTTKILLRIRTTENESVQLI